MTAGRINGDASATRKTRWIPIGSYAVTVSKSGYTTQQTTATVATGATTTLNITLQ